jgi:hypothetical protein
MPDIDADLKEFSAVKARRAPWEPVWELIARYMLQRKQGFTTVNTPGDFYTHEDVCDNTAGQALQTMVSSLDGALWKNGARTFRWEKPRQARDTEEVKKFYAEINSRTVYHMEHEKAAFGTARQESFMESSGFGTGGLGIFAAPAGSEHKVEYKAMALKNLYVVEDSKGRVYKEFYEIEYDAFQLVAEYGEVAQTDKVKSLIEVNNHDTKMKVLWIVRPRADYKKGGDGQTRYSYESVHILVDEKIILREAGYSGNPIVVDRFYKNEGEEYGRSAGYNALSPTIELNALIEMLTKGTELTFLPPWFVLDDGTFGNGVIDRSPGAVISMDVTSSKITGASPIGQIGTVGDMNPALKLVEWLVVEINGHFFVDKLTDLNNKTRMTLGEAQIRNELRADSVGSIYSRQIEEKLTPTIRRTKTVLEEAGELGVEPGSELHAQLIAEGKEPLLIPDELMTLRDQGIEIYQIKYISPAARILRAEELRGVISTWQFAAGFSGVAPELMLRIDKKRSMEVINDLYGAPSDILLSEEKFLEALQMYQQQQMMMMKAQVAKIEADVQAKNASANQQNAQAEATVGGMNGMINGGGAGAGYASMIS